MEQVSGPVIAIGLVLTAVFVPCAFITGIIGQFFRQFALTIAVSTVISAFNSLTLSPALSAILLQTPRQGRTSRRCPWFAFVPIGAWLGTSSSAMHLAAAMPWRPASAATGAAVLDLRRCWALKFWSGVRSAGCVIGLLLASR